jgi:hypothetical protein
MRRTVSYELVMSIRKDAESHIGTPARCRQAVDIHEQLAGPIVEIRIQGAITSDFYIEQAPGDQPHLLIDATISQGHADLLGDVRFWNGVEVTKDSG